MSKTDCHFIEEFIAHDIFTEHWLEKGINKNFKVKKTPIDESFAYSSSAAALMSSKEDITEELVPISNCSFSRTAHFILSNMPVPSLQKAI